MNSSEDRARVALYQIGSALRWLGGSGTIHYRYAAEELAAALDNIRKAERLDAEARDRMAAAAVAPVEA